jgi:hypothetical protein
MQHTGNISRPAARVSSYAAHVDNCWLLVAGSSFIVTVLIWRLYLGWQHVGDRLISATVEYEETGWYDGQVRQVDMTSGDMYWLLR